MDKTELVRTASRRALAETVNVVSVEIVARRDNRFTVNDRSIMSLLYATYRAFSAAWKDLEMIDPVSYAYAWDECLNKLDRSSQQNIIAEVQNVSLIFMNELSEDLLLLLPDMKQEGFAESKNVLANIVNIDYSYCLPNANSK